MKLEIIPAAGKLSQIREIWESLAAEHNGSYFLSWGWIENWLVSLPDEHKPHLMVFRRRGEPFVVFFVGKRDLASGPWIKGKSSPFSGISPSDEVMFCGRSIFKRRALFLNATGHSAFDRLHIEYNGFLYDQQNQDINLAEIFAALPADWDEFYLQGIDISRFLEKQAREELPSYRTIVDREMLSPYVDLTRVRDRGGDYFSLLSANSRAQIRKSYRLCAPMSVELAAAEDEAEAIDIFDELVTLHNLAWRQRQKEGAFHSEYLQQFHRNLIVKRFASGEIQLLKIKCGGHTAGCLYNFVYKNHVFFYQSGINYSIVAKNQFKPGYICHVEAIKYNAAAGHHTYDFMCGSERYKTSLATNYNRLVWMRVQKPHLIFVIERWLKKIYRKLQPKKEANEDHLL